MRGGKVRAVGSSNFPASEIVAAQWVSERAGLARLPTEQPTYSLLNRGIVSEIPVATGPAARNSGKHSCVSYRGI